MNQGAADVAISQNKWDPHTYHVAAANAKYKEDWKVGPRYELIKYLGAGSFSRVCAARDVQTGTVVALKRIPDVVRNLENARKVLREVCIQRRVAHPNVVALHDVFWRPAATGQLRMINGKLQTSSIDVYLALEFCAGGDLHALRGQMTAAQIRQLIAQTVLGVQYLHDLNVWHRDLKSANLLLKVHQGRQVVKIADLGSARSGAGTQPAFIRTESLISEPAGVSMMPFGDARRRSDHDRGLLTMQVCTPCYRAPEVVIARGKYSSAMDMWSLGCIVGELLQRMERSGASITPKLSIDPVFKISPGDLRTPSMDCTFAADDGLAKRELQAIFDVIGTPEWACIDAVDSPAWRHFLTRLPAQAPHLMRSFGFAGEPAVDLLRRMLAFDPERRCSAAEAASHEYLAGAVTSAADGPRRSSLLRQSSDASSSMDTDRGEWPSAAGQAERPLRMQPSSTWLRLLDGMHAAAAGALSPEKRRRSSDIVAAVGDGCDAASSGHARSTTSSAHYADIVEPAAALSALEQELDKLVAHFSERGAPPDAQAICDAICTLIKEECNAEAERQKALLATAAVAGTTSGGGGGELRCENSERVFQRKWWGRRVPLEPDPRKIAAASMSPGPEGAALSGLQLDDRPGVWDPMPVSGSPRYMTSASARLSTDERATSARPEDALKPGRHDEWSIHSGRDLTAPEGPAWGGGMGHHELDDATRSILGQQNAR